MKSHGRLQKDDYVLVMSHSIAGVSADYKLDRYIAICFKILSWLTHLQRHTQATPSCNDMYMNKSQRV